jgi:hypothetical protein
MGAAYGLIVLLLVNGCAARRPGGASAPVLPAAPASGPRYVDLQPGWQLHVVAAAGGAGAPLRDAETVESGRTITVKTGGAAPGFETAVYAVEPAGGGVRIALREVTVQRGGEVVRTAKPAAWRLRTPKRLRRVRLLYTLHASAADHNMALLAARDEARMEALTRRVEAEPEAQCRSAREAFCVWIPAGVAVRPETADGLPVR